MRKLIELGVAIDTAIDAADKYDGGYNFERDRKIRDALMALPTVDAVPVVRCKDCRFSDWYTAVDGKERCYCMEHGSSGHEEMDFCSYGEKDGDT